MRRHIIATAVLLLAGGIAVHAQTPQASTPPGETRELNLRAYTELLRSDVRTQKVAILTEVVGFTEAEDKAFWPIYREYDVEMSKLGDERIAVIAEYARNYSISPTASPTASPTRHSISRPGGKPSRRSTTIASRRRSRRAPRCAFSRSSSSCCCSSICRSCHPFQSRSSRRTSDAHAKSRRNHRAAGLATSVSLTADRVRLRSGKIVTGMFIGGDSKSIRVLLDNGQVSEVALEDAVAVEFRLESRRLPGPGA